MAMMHSYVRGFSEVSESPILRRNFIKTRIRSESVQPRIRVEIDCQRMVTGVVGLIEPVEGLIFVSQPRIRQRYTLD
jgi:hypothetical protein